MRKGLFLVCLLSMFFSGRANDIDSLFREVDASIEERPYAFEEKRKRIALLELKLSESSSHEEEYSLLNQLMNEYGSYKVDSALFYSDKCIQVAKVLDRQDSVIESQLNKAYYLCFLRLFHEAFTILEPIDIELLNPDLQKEYIRTIVNVYNNKVRELSVSTYQEAYTAEIKKYIDLYFQIEDQETVDLLNYKAYKCYLDNDLLKSEQILKQILGRDDLSLSQRASNLYDLGDVYLELGGDYLIEAQKVLAESAIICNRNAITKNPPLLELAVLLSEEDYTRAYCYIKVAIDDMALFSRNHKVDISEKTYNEVQSVYYQKIEQQKRNLQIVLTLVFLLSLILLVVLIMLFISNRNLHKKSLEVVQINNSIKESNIIKDMYISYFLRQYSMFIDKISEYKKHIVRLINAKHTNETIKQ